jgi:hypothetical protein
MLAKVYGVNGMLAKVNGSFTGKLAEVIGSACKSLRKCLHMLTEVSGFVISGLAKLKNANVNGEVSELTKKVSGLAISELRKN